VFNTGVENTGTGWQMLKKADTKERVIENPQKRIKSDNKIELKRSENQKKKTGGRVPENVLTVGQTVKGGENVDF